MDENVQQLNNPPVKESFVWVGWMLFLLQIFQLLFAAGAYISVYPALFLFTDEGPSPLQNQQFQHVALINILVSIAFLLLAVTLMLMRKKLGNKKGKVGYIISILASIIIIIISSLFAIN